MSELKPSAPCGDGLVSSFQIVAGTPPNPPAKSKPAPFSLRLSASERDYLEQQAGSRSLGAYIRARLLGEQAQTRRTLRKPAVDHKTLALVLAELGRSRLSANLNQIAKACNTGTLAVTPGLVEDLRRACADIRAMREMLITALGLKVEG